MFCFDSIVKTIIGKPCSYLLGSTTNTAMIPPEIASIVSLKYRFVVTYSEESYWAEKKYSSSNPLWQRME
jgi:hypothetical protein